MVNLFFLLSGENDTLPSSELKAILDAEGYSYREISKLDQVLRLKVDLECSEIVKKRAALTKIIGLEIFTCKPDVEIILDNVCSKDFKCFFNNNESFAVRVRHVKKSSSINSAYLESEIGKSILKSAENKVNLETPDLTFIGILTKGAFVFGLKIAEIKNKSFSKRNPKSRPFFHPSGMSAKLARCMVNLSKPRSGELVLDPLCGTGSMLIEAALMGCQILGLDIQRRMALGTIENLKHFKISPKGIVVADSKKIPFKKFDCAVTDPPYGRSSTTVKRTTHQIIEEVMYSLQPLIKKGRQICIAAPIELKIKCIGINLGYKHLESHFVYEHKSLTREIAVFEKV